MGGLTIYRAVRRALPDESILYLGDGKNCPYGERPVEEIRQLSEAAVELLLQRGCKLIVVACNTATHPATGSSSRQWDVHAVHSHSESVRQLTAR